jgi:membrane associated rhomboid family serine protease
MNRSESIFNSWVFRLIIVNCIVYALQRVYPAVNYGSVIPAMVMQGHVWQLFTYMFLHDPNNSMHLLFNMYALFMFGLAVEQVWGSRKFIFYYLFCGIGAGIVIFLTGVIKAWFFGNPYAILIPTVGASGAIFGLLLAFGYLFPEAEILLFFFIPMKARTMVIVFGALELGMEISNGGADPVSHVAHLGGLLFGIVYIFLIDRRRSSRKKFVEAAKKVANIVAQESAVEKSAELTDHSRLKMSVLHKLSTGGGLESLTDDEYQMIRYLDIVTESGTFPGKKVLSEEDLDNRKFLETVKKIISI